MRNFYIMISLALTFFVITSYDQPNVLVYNEGDTQISSEVDVYQSLVEGVPIKGNIFVTHDSTAAVDINSFRLGDKPLKVTLAQTSPMSSTGTLVVSVYNFQLDGLKKGVNNLPPIIVRVGGKEYQAPAMSVEIGTGQ